MDGVIEEIKHIKGVHKTSAYVVFNKDFLRALGFFKLGKNTPINIVYDFNKKEICIKKPVSHEDVGAI